MPTFEPQIKTRKRNPLVPLKLSGELPDKMFSRTALMPPSGVIGLFGQKGSGKSMLAAWLAWGRQIKTPGNPKILYFPESYGHLKGEPISLTEMAVGTDRMNGAIIIWDEAQVILNKYRSSSLANRALLGFLTQIRKRGAYLYYTSNSPRQLDRALGEQTDIHAYVSMNTDRRCARYHKPDGTRAHLKDCRDSLAIDWVDTQGVHGKNYYAKDGRLRKRDYLRNLVNYYGLYNTLAMVSALEVDAMNSERIHEAREDQASGQVFAEFVDQMREWVANMAQNGVTALIPSSFALKVEADTGIKVDSRRIGRACNELGLVRHRDRKSVRYELPAAEDAELFRSGMA